MKRFIAILLTLILVFSFSASAQTPDKEYKKVYKTYFNNSYASFNYFTTAYATVREIVANCIDGLVEPDIYGVYVPSLAESWETNEDQTVWTFKIREGLK